MCSEKKKKKKSNVFKNNKIVVFVTSQRKEDILNKYLRELREDIRREQRRGRPRATELFSALQKQHLLRKVIENREALENRTVIDQEDMLRACQIGYEGLEELRDDSIEAIISLVDDISLNNYKKALEPLGNFILGYKTIKSYCKNYLQPDKMKQADDIYKEIKQRINDIDEQTNKMIEEKYTISLQRDYGITERMPRSKGGMGYTTPETIWNIEGVNLTDVNDLKIVDAIAEYQRQTGKNALWRGAKTQPFIRFLKKWKAR